MQAIHIADQSGTTDVKTLLSTEHDGGLASLPNVLHTVLQTEPAAHASVRKANISVQRAAVITFQTWAMKNPGLVGVLYGEGKKGKARKATRIIVAKSFEGLVDDPKTAKLCETESLQPLGVVICGDGNDGGTKALACKWCAPFLTAELGMALCVFVSCK